MDRLRRRIIGGLAGLCALAATLALGGGTLGPATSGPAPVARAALRPSFFSLVISA